jgi:hypothetical protein
MSSERRRINTMLEVLKTLFPSQFNELEKAKRRFDRVCSDYEAAVEKGDKMKAQALIAEVQKAQAALEHPACTLGLAVSTYLATENAVLVEFFSL